MKQKKILNEIYSFVLKFSSVLQSPTKREIKKSWNKGWWLTKVKSLIREFILR